MQARHAWVLVGVITTGCFRAPSADLPDQAAPQALEVRDADGAVFAPDRAPRDPRLLLSFAQTPGELARSLVLLRGALRPSLLQRLGTTRGGSVVKSRTQALRSELVGLGVEVAALAPLDPGARYTLAWLGEDDSSAFWLTVDDGPAAGARWVESWPSDGETSAPAAPRRMLLRFDGRLQGAVAEHASLRTEQGDPVPSEVSVEPCAVRGLPAGDCVWLTPRAALVPGGHYRLALAEGLRALGGTSVPAQESRFTVQADALDTLPELLSMRCALDEQDVHGLCVRVEPHTLHVRGTSDRAVLVTLLSAATSGVVRTATLSFANTFALRHALADDARQATLRVVDLSGRTREHALTFDAAPALASVRIDEVRPDPLGKEPAQEYVELLNFGPTPVSLMGFTLTTDLHERGRTLPMQTVLAAGERVLVVAPDFDPREGSDGVLPGGTRMVMLDGSLSIANSGAQLYLRDASGRRVSSLRVLAPLVEGQCSARYPEDGAAQLDGALESELDPDGSCTPGAATSFTP